MSEHDLFDCRIPTMEKILPIIKSLNPVQTNFGIGGTMGSGMGRWQPTTIIQKSSLLAGKASANSTIYVVPFFFL